MRDLLVLAVTFGFFALCVAYVALCDRIVGPDPARSADGPEQQPAGRAGGRGADEVTA